ncbi:hypothetical protein ACQR16_10040 [Bradyrhizobium oligotrophicum]|uniref:hypothetical protein n=1 Tax=Bradyrhizobium oligotrophicum TaxID=44255 RepID=UPI003EBAEAC2
MRHVSIAVHASALSGMPPSLTAAAFADYLEDDVGLESGLPALQEVVSRIDAVEFGRSGLDIDIPM